MTNILREGKSRDNPRVEKIDNDSSEQEIDFSDTPYHESYPIESIVKSAETSEKELSDSQDTINDLAMTGLA